MKFRYELFPNLSAEFVYKKENGITSESISEHKQVGDGESGKMANKLHSKWTYWDLSNA